MGRRYIEEQFQVNGVVPWGISKNYELSFGLGINVVGTVPGSDPKLAHEIVLVCAHYDHLGKDRKGRICPGAADNASGVAVLLEAARRFGQHWPRPKRTIALAAFDAEEQMLLGSFAFSCRTDVERARIVSVVNVDMFGRDFLDAITNTIFVAGTEGHPVLQSLVRGFGSDENIRVLPVGSDLIGPRSDHVAFQTRDIPCLFFSCGTFRDYHRPEDTPAKINFANLRASADVVLRTVETLANQDVSGAGNGSGCDPEELKSVRTILCEICRDPARAGINASNQTVLLSLKNHVEKILDRGTYTPEAREEIILEAAHSLGSYLLGFGEDSSVKVDATTWTIVLPFLEHIYLKYHRQILEGQRDLVRQVLSHPPGPFHGVPPFRYAIYEIPADDIWLGSVGTSRLALHALGNSFILKAHCGALIWPFRGFEVSFSGSFEVLDCEGTKDQLVDYCLLYAHSSRSNQLHTAAIRKVLTVITGQEPQGEYEDWVQKRMLQGGWRSETEWVLSCLASGEPELVDEALWTVGRSQDVRVAERVREIIQDHRLRPDLRAHAIQVAVDHADKTALLALVEVLDDRNIAYKREDCVQFRPDYPLGDRMTFRVLLPLLESTYSQPPKSIGSIALEGLKKVTKGNFGAEPQKWRAFLAQSK